MKLKDINQGKTRPRSIRCSNETFGLLKVVGAVREQNHEQVLSSLLNEEITNLKLNN